MFQYQHSKDAFYIGKYIEKDKVYAYVLRGDLVYTGCVFHMKSIDRLHVYQKETT